MPKIALDFFGVLIKMYSSLNITRTEMYYELYKINRQKVNNHNFIRKLSLMKTIVLRKSQL